MMDLLLVDAALLRWMLCCAVLHGVVDLALLVDGFRETSE